MNGEAEGRHHVAGGEHRGLVVNKSSQGRCQRVFAIDAETVFWMNVAGQNQVYIICRARVVSALDLKLSESFLTVKTETVFLVFLGVSSDSSHLVQGV